MYVVTLSFRDETLVLKSKSKPQWKDGADSEISLTTPKGEEKLLWVNKAQLYYISYYCEDKEDD